MGDGSRMPPPSGARSSGSLKLRPASKETVDLKFKELDKDIEKIEKIALSAKKKAMTPHECIQEDDLKDLKKAVNGWKTVKIGAVISVVVLVLAGGAQYFSFKNSVEGNQEDIGELKGDVASVKSDVVKVKADVQKVKVIVEEEKQQQVKTDKAQLEAIKAAVKEAVEVSADIRPRRRR